MYLKKEIFSIIDKNAEKIISIGRTIWQNPEPGYREYKTAELVAGFFRELDLPVREKLALTGVRADLTTGKPGPTIAVLGELDSLILPGHCCSDKVTGAAHACGHHASIAALLGTALAFSVSEVKNHLAGNIAFIAVPAEECIEIDCRMEMIKAGKIASLGGKGELIRNGVFNDVSLAMMLHASIAFGYGGHNGFVCKKVAFKGRSCHAGSPGRGINALHAATLLQNAVGLLRERWCGITPAFRIHGIVTSGGDTVNIIPDKVTMEYLIRADKIEYLQTFSTEFDAAANGCAGAIGAEAEISSISGYMPHHDDTRLEELYDQNVSFIAPDGFNRGGTFRCSSTDMGDLSTIMPTLHGYARGMTGMSHGVDYIPENENQLYIENTKIITGMIIDLLVDDAAEAKAVSARREGKLSIADYIALTDKFNDCRKTEMRK